MQSSYTQVVCYRDNRGRVHGGCSGAKGYSVHLYGVPIFDDVHLNIADWGQAVWNKARGLGLQSDYNRKPHGEIHEIVRELMSLPFLPVEEIVPVLYSRFGSLTDERLLQLRKYVFDQWVNSTTFPPVTWNVFRRMTRTNNDCEGWHRRMNSQARETTPPFYELIPLLNGEANKFPLTRVMVAEGSMYRRESLKVKQKDEWYLRLWDLYDEGEMSAEQLLSDVSSTVGPIQ